MKLIESKTLGTAAAAIEFTSIPQDGTDLYVLASTRGVNSAAGGGGDGLIRPNGLSTNQSSRVLYGSGAGIASFTGELYFINNYDGQTANTFSNNSVYIPNYAGSTNKSFSIDTVNENNATAADSSIIAGLWSSTAAITSLTFLPRTGNWAAGTTISLYKITKGSDGIVTTS
jgi:hypothetical protein